MSTEQGSNRYREEYWELRLGSMMSKEQDRLGLTNGFDVTLRCQSEEIAREYAAKLAAVFGWPSDKATIVRWQREILQ